MSVFVTFKRIIRNGVINFLRHGFITLASIVIITITVFSIVASVYVNAAFDAVIKNLEEKVDVNVYFVPNAEEEEIQKIKEAIQKLPGVEKVTHISKQEALVKFKEKYKDDPTTLKALDELDENPLGASLAIKAKDIKYYDEIANYLKSDSFLKANQQSIIEHINYFKNKPIIEKLMNISKNMRIIGLAVIVFLIFASVIIIFNTIRLAIYSSKDEITVLKLVGASNFYARGPFVIESALYGLISGIIVFIATYIISWRLADESRKFFGNFDTYTYFTQNALELLAIAVLSGMFISMISSYLTARKYLRV